MTAGKGEPASENILTPLEAIELSHGLNEMKQALAADRTKLLALGADPGPTEDELFGNGIMNLNSALDLAEDMTVAPGYGDMQDALGVLAKAYRKAEDRIGELLVKNDAKAAALSRAEALLAEAREENERLRRENAILRPTTIAQARELMGRANAAAHRLVLGDPRKSVSGFAKMEQG